MKVTAFKTTMPYYYSHKILYLITANAYSLQSAAKNAPLIFLIRKYLRYMVIQLVIQYLILSKHFLIQYLKISKIVNFINGDYSGLKDSKAFRFLNANYAIN
jgi:hypothetical protein